MILSTSSSKENLLKAIKDYFYSENIELSANGEVRNTKLNKTVGKWRQKKGRFYFETA